MMSGTWIEARDADSIESIAFRHGHHPDTIWNHHENRPLKETRESMHVLAAGDRVFVPDIEPKTVSAWTGQRYTFRRRSVPSRLLLEIRVGDQPLTTRKCCIELEGQAPVDITTDDTGRLEIPISPDASGGRLKIELTTGATIEIPFTPRLLHPVTTILGVQARLRNLGYYFGPLDGKTSVALSIAIAAFLRARKLVLTIGEAAFNAALIEAHGG